MSDLMEEASSSLVFVNARDVAELLGHRFSLVSPDIGVHHGWLPREERERVEREFKAGRLKGLVCTRTPQLGGDIGALGPPLQHMSPRPATRPIPHVARAGRPPD